jgi:hypothetical protein
MSKRLQVILDAREFKSFQQIARETGVSLGEWVRQALRRTAEGFARKTPQAKLKAISRASRHSFPTGDIDDILSEIERGRTGT